MCNARSSRTRSHGQQPTRGASVKAAANGSTDGAAAAHAAAAAAAAGRDGQREVAVLGGEDFILSQRSGVEELLFKGERLGVDADMVAGGGFRQSHLRSLAHLPAGLLAPPRFLERVAVHYARNALAGLGALPGQVPLVLGIWGPKGMGKTFTLELCLRTMGVLPVCLSAGELEDEWAGEPGRRLRERYSFAARHAESTGEPTCLVISDLDAGVGTFANTGNTVNTQNLQGSLMALCDDPLAVSTGQDWGAMRPRCRVPIFVTANDLSLLYAPLVREGRMDKFLYEPTREEMAGALEALFAPHLGAPDVQALLDAFPCQPMDFFGAIQSRLVDDSVRRWLREAGGGEGIGAALFAAGGCAPASVEPDVSLEAALAAGAALAAEQQSVMDVRLSLQYMKGLDVDRAEAGERSQRWRQHAARDAARRLAAAEAAEAVRARAAEAVWAAAAEKRVAAAEEAAEAGDTSAQEKEEEEQQEEEEGPPQPTTVSGLPGVSPDDLAAALTGRRVAVLDVRGAREWDWGRIKGAKHAPIVVTTCTSLAPQAALNPAFLDDAGAALGPPDSCPPVVLVGPGPALGADTDGGTATSAASYVSKEQFVSVAPSGTTTVDGQDVVSAAAAALQAAGYRQLAELQGGYRAWDLAYRPDGRRRAKGAFRDKSSGELEWWTASN